MKKREEGDPFVDNAADARQVRLAKKLEKARRERQLKDMHDVAGTEAGKRLLWEIMEECNVFNEITGTIDVVYFEEGRRSVGLKILREMVQAAPEVLTALMSEGMVLDSERKRQAEDEKESGEEKPDDEDVGHHTD